MAGDQWLAKLDPYLDGELPDSEMRAIDEHLRSCTSCTAAILARVRMKRAVQLAGKRFTPPAELRRKIQGMVAQKPHRPWSLNWGFVGVVAAIVVVAAALAGYFGRQGLRQRQTFSELADLHVATLASSTPVDVVSSDRHTVKPWFQGKIPFSFSLPELQNSDFSLIGGRVTYLDQSPGAHLIYRIRKHQISVFIFQERDLAERGLPKNSPLQKRMTFNTRTWQQSGLRYFVIGDTSAEDVGRLCELLQSAAGS